MHSIGKAMGALALFVASAGASAAATVYDSGVTAGSVNGVALADLAVSTALTSAQSVTFSSDVALTGAEWTGIYGGNTLAVDVFSLNVYADVAGAPGAAALSSTAMTATRLATPFTFVSTTVFDYDGSFAALNLSAGSYWFSVVNDTTSTPATQWQWALNASGGPGDGFLAGQPGLSVDFDLTLLGDEVTATVPLPASLPALGAALLLLGAWRRRA